MRLERTARRQATRTTAAQEATDADLTLKSSKIRKSTQRMENNTTRTMQVREAAGGNEPVSGEKEEKGEQL